MDPHKPVKYEFYANHASGQNTDPHVKVKLEGGTMKLENEVGQIKSPTNIDLVQTIKKEIDTIDNDYSDYYDNQMNVKLEPEADECTMTNMEIPLFANFNSHQTVKHETPALGDDFNNDIDVKVEEHPVQEDIKQENELCSNLSIADNTTSDSYHDLQNNISSEDTLNFKKHLDTIINKKRHQCTYCEKSYSHKTALKDHQRIHTDGKLYQCKNCEKFFALKSSLIQHEKIHSGDKPYQCSQCEKSFTQNGTLVQHMKTHTGVKPYHCNQCEKCFARKSQLVNHHRLHTGEKPYQCSHCDKYFSHSSGLVVHERTHTGEKPYQCTHCDKCFTDKGSLVKHQRTHTGEKPYQCSHCDKCFTQKPDMLRHQRIHTGEKPYQCSDCDKSFTCKTQLVEHRKVHIKGKPHQCSMCEKCFAHKSQLVKHCDRMHTGEKNHQCSQCDQWFAEKWQITKHQLSHNIDTKEKKIQSSHSDERLVQIADIVEPPHQCSHCGKRFTCEKKLAKHQKKHTEDLYGHYEKCFSKDSRLYRSWARAHAAELLGQDHEWKYTDTIGPLSSSPNSIQIDQSCSSNTVQDKSDYE
ncbi:unnamed protein product [Meganyctiphanes norvegica]|uniref:Protein krueppel n=1 Tax=Meganyctiphanes norvegica TaxID=48144 RepID=A0AAV2QVV1_MEGNR